jgi:hypothetical protein
VACVYATRDDASADLFASIEFLTLADIHGLAYSYETNALYLYNPGRNWRGDRFDRLAARQALAAFFDLENMGQNWTADRAERPEQLQVRASDGLAGSNRRIR